ncbi:MAG TPA: 3'-5' exonuclease [Sulfurimonas sp.]|nr:3'-5' exonuclease [Sulfurimonas sp.]
MFAFIKNWQKSANISKLKDKDYSFLFDEDKSGEYVVFDTETTGLNPKVDDIISIGAVKIKDNKIITSDTFEVFVKSNSEINPKSIEIHQIRNCDLELALDIDDAIKQFLNFIGSKPIIGYYLEFDIAMINKYVKPLLGVKLPNRAIEVSEIYFDKTIALIPQGNIDLRFDTILSKCGVPDMGAHNAVNDAIMTAMIYLKLTQTK